MRSPTAVPNPPHAVATLPLPATCAGVVERLLFHNPSGPYTAALLLAEGADRPVSIVGRFPEVRAGEYLRCTGSWEMHARYGRQFRVADVTLILPSSVEGLRRYLSSPLVGGIGPVMARRLVEYFGADALTALDSGADTVRQVPGIGPARAAQISAGWQQHRELREVLLALFDLGISYRRAEQLYQHYGAQVSLLVRRDPYRLALDVRGIGFHTADRIAAAAEVPADAPMRLQAGLLHCLQAATIAGHTWLPTMRLLEDGEALLSKRAGDGAARKAVIGRDRLDGALQTLVESGAVTTDTVASTPTGTGTPTDTDEPACPTEPACALAAIDTLERALAHGLLRLIASPFDRMPAWSTLSDAAWSERFAAHAAVAGRLSGEQRAAVQMGLSQRVSVLTGGPGTGKTTALRALVALAHEGGARLALAAPTGKAARRLAEATGQQACTIHRLLGRRLFGRRADGRARSDVEAEEEALALPLPGHEEDGPERLTVRAPYRQAPLRADLVVIDEASMLDLPLARALVRAIPPGAHLLLVGDADQLPSVGPGQVLADIIASGQVPVTRLQQIFRQGEGSGIAANAQRINAGEMPVWEPGLGSNDFYLFNAEDATTCRNLVLDLVSRRITSRFGLSSSAVQVLAPMHRGPLGLTALNPEIQAVLNPPTPGKPELSVGVRLLRVGDRVVQSRNNYDLGVFNGDTGTLVALDPAGYQAQVQLDDGRDILYPPSALPDLHLAYALSIHRAQGSEFPAVVLPVVTGQFILLSRRLLYTAVTRAQRLVVLVGHSRAVSFAVRDAGSEARLTALVQRLLEPPSPAPPPPLGPPRRRAKVVQPTLL